MSNVRRPPLMRKFYAFWFVFSSGWGYLLASFTETEWVPQGHILATFAASFLTFLMLFGIALYRLPAGRHAQPPSLALKPWNQPTGLLLFLSLTFIFSSVWGVGIAVVTQLPGLRVAADVLAMGSGALSAIFVCRYALPAKFGV